MTTRSKLCTINLKHSFSTLQLIYIIYMWYNLAHSSHNILGACSLHNKIKMFRMDVPELVMSLSLT